MGKWITGKQPEKSGNYLVTIETFIGLERQVRQARRLEYPKGNWYWYILPSGGSSEVIAWQKQPDPYKK